LKPLLSLAIPILFAGFAAAEPVALAPAAILEQYAAAARESKQSLRGASMEVEIEASLPKLKKSGRLQALRRISDLGRITYEALKFDGDDSVKKNVIVRYLSAEAEASERNEQAETLAVTPANYKFKYRGQREANGRMAHVFEVKPRKKRVGLYKGELWLDVQTSLPLRETGRFVKNPSIFLKRVEFTREYDIVNGISVPRQVQSTIYTRLVGTAELLIHYRNPLPVAAHRKSLFDVSVTGY
jgi:hypothetical protein